MATPSGELIEALQAVLQRLHQNPYPHVPNPEGNKKRASVALVLRVRPAYPIPSAPPSEDESFSSGSPPKTLEDFFSQSWVAQEGDPEVLFIKRTGRVGDRWSGHVALPGGKRDPPDADDLAAAIRETREEVGLDLTAKDCLHVGNLPERVVTTSWGKEPLMVLCPYIFLYTGKQIPPLTLQPTEIAATHWVPLRALLSPSCRTREFVDVSSRFAKQGGPIVRALLRALLGKMMFSAVELIPSESLYSTTTSGFVPEKSNTAMSRISDIIRIETGLPLSTSYGGQRLLLWGLTLGVLADFLETLPPYNAVQLWQYPTFTTLDLRAIIYLFTYKLRKDNARDLSCGTWPNQTAVDATTQATAVFAGEPRRATENVVGIGGLVVGSHPIHAVGKMLSGYYERLRLAISVFLVYRTILGSALLIWAVRTWRARRRR